MPDEQLAPVRASRLGVVVAAYNAERWLEMTLDNLREQSFRDWRCVVVDDGSVDATAVIAGEMAAKDHRFLVVRQPNGGPSLARNTGLAALPAELDYIAFLDADDMYAEHGLSQLVRALDDRPDAVGVFGLADMIDESGELLAPGVHPSRQRDRRRLKTFGLAAVPAGADSTFDDIIVYNPVWPALVAILRLPAVRRIGGFDASVSLREDWDLYLRLSRNGSLAVVDDVVAYYRRHGANLTRNVFDGLCQRELVLRKSYNSPENSPRQRVIVRRVWRRQEVPSLVVMARLVVNHCRTRRWREAIRVATALVWTLVTLLQRRPPRPSRRRLDWSGVSITSWDITAPLAGSWRTRLGARIGRE